MERVRPMMIKETLAFVAHQIDGELVECDDGFVICCKSPFLWIENKELANKSIVVNKNTNLTLESIAGIDFLYNEDGTFDKVQYCGRHI